MLWRIVGHVAEPGYGKVRCATRNAIPWLPRVDKKKECRAFVGELMRVDAEMCQVKAESPLPALETGRLGRVHQNILQTAGTRQFR